MIDVKDLRIGNLIRINNPKYFPEIKGVILSVTAMSERLGLDKENTYSIGLEHY